MDELIKIVEGIPLRAKNFSGISALEIVNPNAALTLKKIALLSAGLRGALLVFKGQISTPNEGTPNEQ